MLPSVFVRLGQITIYSGMRLSIQAWRLFVSQTARSGSQTFSSTTGKLSGQKGKKWVYSWMCFNSQAYLSIFIEMLGTLSIIWDCGSPWGFVGSICPVSGILCPSTQACSIQHAALNGCVCRAVHYRFVGTCVHIGTESFLHVVITLPLNDSSYSHSKRNCWSTGFMAGVHCLDSGPHLMHCPLCSWEHCGVAEHRRLSSPATLGSLYLMGERQSSSSNSLSPEVRKRRICQLAKAIWFVEWKPRRRVSRQIKFPEVISKIIC